MRVTFHLEKEHLPHCCFGLDEVGCAPLAGPVVAACVHIPENVWRKHKMAKLRDSKLVPKPQRENLAAFLRDHVAHGIGQASVEEIDTINILQAGLLAMRRAFENCPKPDGITYIALIDGNQARNPRLEVETHMIVGGDNKCRSIAAASIIAKVYRDALMAKLAEEFPHYGWHTNVGYGCKKHYEGLREHGPTAHHRRSFAPIRELLEAAA